VIVIRETFGAADSNSQRNLAHSGQSANASTSRTQFSLGAQAAQSNQQGSSTEASGSVSASGGVWSGAVSGAFGAASNIATAASGAGSASVGHDRSSMRTSAFNRAESDARAGQATGTTGTIFICRKCMLCVHVRPSGESEILGGGGQFLS